MSAPAGRMHFIVALIALAAAASAIVTPSVRPAAPAPDLEAMLPDAFGQWRRVEISAAVLPQELELGPGEAAAYRAYRNDVGRVVTLVAAYGPPLGDSVRLHRPEACYVAQGFEIRTRIEGALRTDGRDIAVVNLEAESPSRREAVTYWLRDGSAFTTVASEAGWLRLQRASGPRDGALVRISSASAGPPDFDLNREFLAAFAAALEADGRRTLLGEGSGS
jgi:EpsI family protein